MERPNVFSIHFSGKNIAQLFLHGSHWCLARAPRPQLQSRGSLGIIAYFKAVKAKYGRMIPSGYVKIAIEHGHLQWIYPLKMVISHSCVSLPEGNCKIQLGPFSRNGPLVIVTIFEPSCVAQHKRGPSPLLLVPSLQQLPVLWLSPFWLPPTSWPFSEGLFKWGKNWAMMAMKPSHLSHVTVTQSLMYPLSQPSQNLYGFPRVNHRLCHKSQS